MNPEEILGDLSIRGDNLQLDNLDFFLQLRDMNSLMEGVNIEIQNVSSHVANVASWIDGVRRSMYLLL